MRKKIRKKIRRSIFKDSPTKTKTEMKVEKGREKFAKHFKRFVEKGFPQTLFYKAFYNRIMLMRGHIAHYDQGGFYEAHFSTPQRRANFLNRWAHLPIYGDPTYTWSDVEEDLAGWLRENPQYEEKERNTHNQLVEQAERAELARLTAKYIND